MLEIRKNIYRTKRQVIIVLKVLPDVVYRSCIMNDIDQALPNRDQQQCSLSLVVKSGTIKLSPVQGTKPAYRQCNIKENLNYKVQKLLDENIRHSSVIWVIIINIFILNPLHAKFFRGNINIYLHFVSFLHIDATQVVEILPQIRQEPYLFYIVSIMAADVLAT